MVQGYRQGIRILILHATTFRSTNSITLSRISPKIDGFILLDACRNWDSLFPCPSQFMGGRMEFAPGKPAFTGTLALIEYQRFKFE
jgi:hypothetical protein